LKLGRVESVDGLVADESGHVFEEGRAFVLVARRKVEVKLYVSIERVAAAFSFPSLQTRSVKHFLQIQRSILGDGDEAIVRDALEADLTFDDRSRPQVIEHSEQITFLVLQIYCY
jgi:hypothetical protein